MNPFQEFSGVLKLSPARLEILRMLGRGMGTVSIGKARGNSSTKSVEYHMARMKKILGVESGDGLRAYAGRFVMLERMSGLKAEQHRFTKR